MITEKIEKAINQCAKHSKAKYARKHSPEAAAIVDQNGLWEYVAGRRKSIASRKRREASLKRERQAAAAAKENAHKNFTTLQNLIDAAGGDEYLESITIDILEINAQSNALIEGVACKVVAKRFGTIDYISDSGSVYVNTEKYGRLRIANHELPSTIARSERLNAGIACAEAELIFDWRQWETVSEDDIKPI